MISPDHAGAFVVEVGVSLRPMDLREVPELTARVARTAFPSGTAAMRVRDSLGPIFTDDMFRDAFPSRGKPALSPARLALVSVLQFAEGLADRQAADAVRARIDWKYALGLELTDPGFDYSVLSEFRSRLINGGLEQAVFTAVVDAARASGLVKARGKQRTDSTHVITAVREVNRLERCIETMRAALNALAALAPTWVAALADAEWFDRYSDRPEQYHLPAPGTRKRIALAEQVGADGFRLMTAVFAGDAPAHLRQVEAVEVLRQTWVQEYAITSTDDGQERIVWRHPKDCPPGAVRLASPYDTDARNAVKRDTSWSGYKVHLTETCDPDEVHLITHVATTVATTPDTGMIAEVHRDLAQRDLLPSVHLADAGYVNAPHLVSARRDHDVTLIGPVQGSTVRKADSGFSPSAFTIDWDTRTATCPGGQTTTNWREATSQRGTPVSRIRFLKTQCQPCPARSQCTTSSSRNLTLRPREEHEALQSARADQSTAEWKRRYQPRAGIEATISQGVRSFNLRRSRYRGLPKTSLQHQLTGAAINLNRIGTWLDGRPHGRTRTSHFAALRPGSDDLRRPTRTAPASRPREGRRVQL